MKLSDVSKGGEEQNSHQTAVECGCADLTRQGEAGRCYSGLLG